MIHKRGKVTIREVQFRFNNEAVAEMILRYPAEWEVFGKFFGPDGRVNERKFFHAYAMCAQEQYTDMDTFRDEFLDELTLTEFAQLKAVANSSLDDLVKKNNPEPAAEEAPSHSTSKKSTRKQSEPAA